MMNPRASWLSALAVAAALLGAPSAATSAGPQDYPNQPLKIIVPFTPGGGVDVVARIVAPKLGEALGQSVIIENRGGAGGMLGAASVAQAAPDGYTLLFGTGSTHGTNSSVYAKLNYDPVRDFVPVALVTSSPLVLVVNPSLPVKDVKELAALVKANPSKYNIASAGIGTTPHLSGEIFRLMTDPGMVHVPFNGSAPAMQSALGGHTPIAFIVLSPAVPQVKEGKLRALAVLSTTRSAALPDVPSIVEAGFVGVEADTQLGVLVPAATPKEIVDRLHREIVAILALPDVNERLATLGFVPVASTQAAFASLIGTEIERWRKVIKDAHIKPE